MTLSSFSYKFDAAGNRLRVIEANGDTVTWAYDKAYQLINEKRSGANSYNVTYLYDPAGNRLRKTDTGAITTSTYDAANQLIKQNTAGAMTTFLFDRNGNQQRTTSSILTTYTWDFENRPTKIRQGNPIPTINTMIYDGDGKRVRKDDSSGSVKHIWDGANILEETDQNDATKVIFTLSPSGYGDLISQIRTLTSSFYIFDALGSTDRLTDTTGQIVTDSYVYKAFGELLTNIGTTVNPFRFIGEKGYYYDADFLEYWLRARVYGPAPGRFLSFDTLPLADSSNLYAYVSNRPTLGTDPSGRLKIIPVNQQLGKLKCQQTGFIDWRFELSKEAKCEGYIVQRIEFFCDIGDCCGKCPTDLPKKPSVVYYEAWKVLKDGTTYYKGGQITDSSSRDFSLDTCGITYSKGVVKFYCAEKDPKVGNKAFTGNLEEKWKHPKEQSFGSGKCVVDAGEIPAIEEGKKPPDFWKEDSVEGPKERWTKFFWNCCANATKFAKAEGSPQKE
jgi:RHS repeat-associated protein